MTNIQPLPQYHDLRVDPFMSQEGWQRPFCVRCGGCPPHFLSCPFFVTIWSLKEGGICWTLALLEGFPAAPG